MKIKTLIIATTASAMGLAAISVPVMAKESAKAEAKEKAEAMHAPAHKISRAQAQAIALRTVPGGRVVEYDFEKEGGGWRHSFDIRVGKITHEIGVDANSGKIVENSVESGKDKD